MSRNTIKNIDDYLDDPDLLGEYRAEECFNCKGYNCPNCDRCPKHCNCNNYYDRSDDYWEEFTSPVRDIPDYPEPIGE